MLFKTARGKCVHRQDLVCMQSTAFTKYIFGYSLIITLAAFVSCNLEQDISIDLPPYTNQPVVEVYLTPGQKFTLLLTRSAGFFDSFQLDNQQFVENTFVDSAEVTIRYADQVIEFENETGFDFVTGQVSNYESEELVPENYADSFFLDIRFPDGTVAKGATVLLPPVPIDSNAVVYNDAIPADADTLARIITYFTDPDSSRTNRFRQILTYSPLDSTVEQNLVFTDRFADRDSFGAPSTFEFPAGDTIYVYLAHVDRDYELYFNSVEAGVASNGNPFVQPSAILSNVSGSANPIGIFTGYSYVVDTVIIPPR